MTITIAMPLHVLLAEEPEKLLVRVVMEKDTLSMLVMHLVVLPAVEQELDRKLNRIMNL